MEFLNQRTAKGMELVHGRITSIGKDGKLQVKIDHGGCKITCDFLRTHSGPLPGLYLGTPVLCLTNGTKGYVLGVIQPYLVHKDNEDERTQETAELNLRAGESIELACGESVLSMTKDGKIVLRGTDITTRAARHNKIKGASVRIN